MSYVVGRVVSRPRFFERSSGFHYAAASAAEQASVRA